MKLRILDNSIRLRLRRSEVEQLAVSGRVEAVCELGGQPLRYAVTAEPVDAMRAEHDGSTVTVRIPRADVEEWAATRRVGLKGTCGALTVLVEKDFVRSFVKEADDYDRYMNPRTGRMPPPVT